MEMGIKNDILVLMFTCFYALANAQPDKIYLKNKSLVFGDIAFIGKDSIAVQLTNNKIWLKTADVYRLVVRSDGHGIEELKTLKAINDQKFLKRFEKVVQVGLLAGHDGEPFPGISGLGIYKFRRFLQFGAGIDYNTYDEYRSLPVYLYYKGDLSIGIDGFFYYGGYGYGKAWQRQHNSDMFEKVTGGFIKKAGLGYVFGSDKLRIMSSVGWTQQKVEEVGYTYRYYWGSSVKTIISRSINRFEFKIGVSI